MPRFHLLSCGNDHRGVYNGFRREVLEWFLHSPGQAYAGVNYLSHHAVARAVYPDAAPEFYVGNVLPDLLSTSGEGRLRIKRVAEEEGELARGVRLHLATDHRFHGHPAFAEAMAEASELLKSALFSSPPRRVFFLAHVFVEIALDGLLARESPARIDDFYAQFDRCDLAAVIVQTETWLEAERPLLGLAYTIERFVAARYLYTYSTGEGQAQALHRVGQRAGVSFGETPQDRFLLAELFTLFTASIGKRAAVLLATPAPGLWYNSTDSSKLLNSEKSAERNEQRADRND